MRHKIICFHCKEYSGYGIKKPGCFRCGSSLIARAGSAFRLPKKTDLKAWKELEEIFMLQHRYQSLTEPVYFLGWGNKAYWHKCKDKKNMPKAQKEKATREAIRRAYSK